LLVLSQAGGKVDLRLLQVGKTGKMKLSPWFDRDLVVHGSSALRRRAPHNVGPSWSLRTRGLAQGVRECKPLE